MVYDLLGGKVIILHSMRAEQAAATSLLVASALCLCTVMYSCAGFSYMLQQE